VTLMPKPSNCASGHGDRSADALIRAAMRSDGLLVPQTEAEMMQFEAELAMQPVAVPAHLQNPECLFRHVEPACSVEQTPLSAAENRAIAARDGSTITDEIASLMQKDRAAVQNGQPVPIHRPDSRENASHFNSSKRRKEIAELAEWIAQEQAPKGAVDLAQIASAANLSISFNDYEEAFDGLLEHSNSRFHIYCNLRRVEQRNSPRAKFTLAHEFGHYFIDEHRLKLERGESLPLSQCDYESAHPIEREADLFAANLLMPKSRIAKASRGLSPGIPGILALSRHFGTSVTSTACRCADMGIGLCVVVKWSNQGIGWRFVGQEAREAGLFRTVDSSAQLAPGSATARALAGEPVPAKGYFETGTTAASWFPSVHSASFRNAVFVEHAMPLGRFGAITVLFPTGLT
jgi:Zn-dependent peptidase ImmA (M78 family)